MARWYEGQAPRMTSPITFEVGGQTFTGLVTDININVEQDWISVGTFDDPHGRIRGASTRHFEIRGQLVDPITYNTSANYNPPPSANAVDKYREGGPIVPMGKKLMAKVPWSSPKVALIGVGADGTMGYAKTLDEKQQLIFNDDFDYLLVAWPGLYSQDIFCVSDVTSLARALGLKPKSEVTFVDDNGTEWVR